MGNRGLVSSHKGASLKDYVVASDADDAADTAGPTADRLPQLPEKKVYVKVTILAEKVGTTEDGTIKLKRLVTWESDKILYDNSERRRQFYMFHIKRDGNQVQLGICEEGPFRPIHHGQHHCSIIYVTGEDHESTMSNKDDTLYLRARRRGKPVVIRRHPNVNSYFIIEIVGYHPGGPLVTINVKNRPELYFKYDERDSVVLTDTYNQHNRLAYQFVLTAVHPREIHFVTNKDST